MESLLAKKIRMGPNSKISIRFPTKLGVIFLKGARNGTLLDILMKFFLKILFLHVGLPDYPTCKNRIFKKNYGNVDRFEARSF